MYVPWIHGNAPVPEWWKELERRCELRGSRIPCPPAWLAKFRDEERVALLQVLRARARVLELNLEVRFAELEGKLDWGDSVLLAPWPTEYP